MDRLRNCCVTWHVTGNNTYETLIDLIKTQDFVTYGILGREVCPTTQNKHLQGYLEFKDKKTLNSLIKIWKGIHIEKRMGTQEQAIEYCKKDGDFAEFGEKKKQGLRTDISVFAENIKNGTYTVNHVLLENPQAYHCFGRTLEAIEAIVNEKKYRNWMTTCEWIYGPTGVGKSHYAYYNWDPEKCYEWKLDEKSGWQDGYRGQEYVVINDFRGEIPYNNLLKMIDKFPYYTPRRCKAPHPFLAKHIVITSSLPPEKVYKHRDAEDSLEQLLRRIVVINFKTRTDCEARLVKHYCPEVPRG